MDTVLELMIRAESLIYEVNTLMQFLDVNNYKAFLDAAEEGKSVDGFPIDREELKELFEKRQAIFAMNNRIMMLMQDLTTEEKAELADQIHFLSERNKIQHRKKKEEYQRIIDFITSPEFTFEGNEGYKQRVIDLKDEYMRCAAAATYYDNMEAYLGVNRRSK